MLSNAPVATMLCISDIAQFLYHMPSLLASSSSPKTLFIFPLSVARRFDIPDMLWDRTRVAFSIVGHGEGDY